MRPQRILVLYKMSTYQYYQDRSECDRPDDCEVDRFQKTHDAHYRSLESIEQALVSRSLDYDKVERGQLKDYGNYDLIITVGGDGTFLEAARYTDEQLILGINSDPNWSVGRLCLARKETIGDYLDAMLSENFQHGSLNRMKISFEKACNVTYFINDILISHLNPASLSRYVLKINDSEEEQRSSGVWFSTASGSTGAVHSAGGPVLDIKSDNIVYMPRELYRGWTKKEYAFMGEVLSSGSRVEVSSLMAEGMVFVDGSHQRISFPAPERLLISRAENPLRLVVLQ